MADTEKIRIRSLDTRRYAETFEVFVRHSLEYPQMLDELVRLMRERLPGDFRVLDVGAGTGMVIRDWIQQSGVRPSYYTAFEPNPSHVETLTATIDAMEMAHDIQPLPFSADRPLHGQYDIALFSHSLYWMKDPALEMLQATSALAPGGLALAFIGGPYGVYGMFPLFEPYLERTTPMLQNNTMSSHELIQGLRRRGVEPEVRILPTPLDLSGLFEREGRAELGEFLSFCMQLEFSQLPDWLQTDVIRYVQGGCVPRDGCQYWYQPTAVVVVNK
ncbi:MAG: methyltransferase domain-containing protein [Pseudomonadota bacterium]